MAKNLDRGLFQAMRAFLKVVEAGSFTGAAERLNMATAQVSRSVAELEDRLQTKLLQRTTRRVVLTGAGEAYAENCRDILERLAQAEGFAGISSSRLSGELRVGSMTSFGNRYVAPLLVELCEMYPEVTVRYSASQYQPDLLGDRIDVSFYLAQGEMPDSTQVCQRLGVYSVYCARHRIM